MKINEWMKVAEGEKSDFYVRGIQYEDVQYLQCKYVNSEGKILGKITEYPVAYIDMLNTAVAVLEEKFGEDWSL
jgi:hypothetical protein